MNQTRLIRASEIGQYLFCQRAWWLAQVQGVASTNLPQMTAGAWAHQQHGRRLAWALRARRAGFILLIAGFGLLGLYLLAVLGGS